MHQKLALGFVLVGLVCRVAAAASAEPSIWLRMSPDSTCENIAEAMGRYRLNGTANGYPRFQLASVDVVRFLCRTHALSTKPGLWSVTGSEANIEKLKGTIVPIIAVESPVGQKYMAHCASDKQWDVDDTFLVLDVSYEGAKADQEATEANKAEQEAPAKEARADADVFASAPKAEQETEDAEARVSTARGLEVCECASGQTLGDDEAGSNVSTHSNSAGWVPTLQQLGITLFGLAMVVVCFTVVPAIWMQPMQPMQISSEVPDEDLMNVLHDVEKKTYDTGSALFQRSEKARIVDQGRNAQTRRAAAAGAAKMGQFSYLDVWPCCFLVFVRQFPEAAEHRCIAGLDFMVHRANHQCGRFCRY